MDAWETLTSNSSLPTGDAWEHLNAQIGGGAGYIFVDKMEIEVEDFFMDIEIDDVSFDVEIADFYFDLEIEDNELEIEVV